MGKPLRVLHIIGQLEPGGVTSWLKALLSCTDRSQIVIDICCNYRLGTGVLTESFAEFGCNIHHIPLNFNLPRYESRIVKLIKGNNYQIVHDHRSFLAGATLRAAKKAGIRARIVYHHTPDDDLLPDLPRRIYGALLKRWTLKYATQIWGCSNAALSALYGKDWRSKDKRLEVVYGAVSFSVPKPIARLEIRKEFGIGVSDPVIGFVARMTRAKNPFVALDVCKKVIENNKNVNILWVGDGSLLAGIKNQVVNFKFKNNFKFTGFRKDIPELLSAMDIYLQPSLWEGLPLGTLEALRAGLPVIGSKAPGLLEALPEEFHYLCSDANDVDGHVNSIVKYLKANSIRLIPEDFLDKFTPNKLCTRIFDKYEKTIQSE
jgi:glycosyltransferase EpsF